MLNSLSLWEMGSKPSLPTFTYQQPAKPLVPLPPPAVEAGPSRLRTPSPDTTTDLSNLAISSTEVDAPVASIPRLDPSEISTLLHLSLLRTLPSLPTSSFPIPASLLYSAHVLPSRPAYIPKEQRDDVVIGKSEWKKLAKWMKEAGKDGLLKVKETKGELVIQG
jgi:translation initiation factor 2D